MNDFRYVGQVPASKSLLNRALIVQSFFPQLHIKGDSHADDVMKMRLGLQQLAEGQPINCGDAGTVFRFLALRAARISGKHRLLGTKRLLQRPQTELIKILGQLGCAATLTDSHLDIQSWGWKMVGDALHVPMDRSSQFASAVILSAWQLPFEVLLLLGPSAVSNAYLDMTMNLVSQLGMVWSRDGGELRIPVGQQITQAEYQSEPDMSSAFALAAAAAVAGRISLTGMPEKTVQPDGRFVNLLRDMGVPVLWQKGRLEVQNAEVLKPLTVSLNDTPDLFPVLAALCALAPGSSHLTGAQHLIHKESNRLEKTAELLRLCGREVKVLSDGLQITGHRAVRGSPPVTFNPDHDHRMAMAAATLKLAGEPIDILHPEVVSKSFPGYWSAIGLSP